MAEPKTGIHKIPYEIDYYKKAQINKYVSISLWSSAAILILVSNKIELNNRVSYQNSNAPTVLRIVATTAIVSGIVTWISYRKNLKKSRR